MAWENAFLIKGIDLLGKVLADRTFNKLLIDLG